MTCDECGKEIGKLEARSYFNGKMLCAGCAYKEPKHDGAAWKADTQQGMWRNSRL